MYQSLPSLPLNLRQAFPTVAPLRVRAFFPTSLATAISNPGKSLGWCFETCAFGLGLPPPPHRGH